VGIGINCALAWFNLLPIPPLDGSHIACGLLPESLAVKFQSLGRYGMVIIVLLLASGLVGRVIVPLIDKTSKIITGLIGL
jgi:Zn-dependent protease